MKKIWTTLVTAVEVATVLDDVSEVGLCPPKAIALAVSCALVKTAARTSASAWTRYEVRPMTEKLRTWTPSEGKQLFSRNHRTPYQLGIAAPCPLGSPEPEFQRNKKQ